MSGQIVIAGVAILQAGKLLLVQEKQAKAYGLWNLPAGHVDPGETVAAAAIREAHEEVGYQVELLRELPVIHSPDAHELHAFAARITGGELHIPEDEILDARWFTPAEVRAMTAQLRSAEYILGALDALASA